MIGNKPLAADLIKESEPQRKPPRWRRYLLPYGLLLPSLIVFLAVVLYPTFETVRMSFYNVQLTATDAPFVGLQNYRAILSSSLLKQVIVNSIVWTVGSVSLQFLIGFSLALALDRLGRTGDYLRGFLLLSWVMPGIVIAFIWRFMLSPDWGVINWSLIQLGLIDDGIAWLSRGNTAMLSVIVANAWKGFPFWMVMLSAGLKSINKDIYDSAAVDGATGLRLIWYIIIPLIRFPLFVTSTLTFIWTFNYFDLIFGMTGGGPLDATRNVPLYIYDTAFTSYRMGHASAASVLLIVVMSFLVIGYARLLRIQGEETP
ncbi:MAG: sugar ABC transporter permease [Candidatus Promineifilaceae bacterium]|nr:sugar ABC transporter permease [Candidatus Promineifilaceae bacterium]